MKTKLKFITFSATTAIALLFAFITGCSDPTDPNPIYINNPNVTSYDSIGVDEDEVAFFSYTGLNLLNGSNTLDTSRSRDCSLQDLNNSGKDFYLQNGVFDKVLPGGYEIRFFRVDPNMSVQSFDTLSRIYGTGQDTLRPMIDFTADNTAEGNWGYFNAPMLSGSSQPVFCFWLKGRKDENSFSKNVYGIIQPREATDPTLNNVYGYRMSFRVRINTNGENDFRKQILQSN